MSTQRPWAMRNVRAYRFPVKIRLRTTPCPVGPCESGRARGRSAGECRVGQVTMLPVK